MPPEIHISDLGTAFRYQCLDQDSNIIDLTNVDTMSITFTKPDRSKLIITPVFVTDGSDGRIQYLSRNGDLSVPGLWRAEVYISFGTASWHSDITEFRVWSNL